MHPPDNRTRNQARFLALLMLTIILLLAFGKKACAGGLIRTVYLSDSKVERITVRPGRLTVLNFPLKPDTTALSPGSLFSLKYVENDIIISGPSGATTNMFVYLMGRRFGFEIATSSLKFDEVVHVRDALAQPPKNTKEHRRER